MATVLFSLGPSRKLVRANVVTGFKENAAEPVGKRRGIVAVRNLLVPDRSRFPAIELGLEMGSHFYARIRTDLAGYGDAQSRELLRAAVEHIEGFLGVESAFSPRQKGRLSNELEIQLKTADEPPPLLHPMASSGPS